MKNDLPPVGTRLFGHRHGGIVIEAEIVKDSQFRGGKAIQVLGHRYGSLSTAAKAVCDNEINGWAWWRTDSGRSAREAYIG